MFLLFCMVTNCLSIMAPVHLPAGSFRPSHVKAIPILLHLGFFFLFPPVLALTLIPWGLEVLLQDYGWGTGVPICLLLSLVLAFGLVLLYRVALRWQGAWLQAREQRILEIVTARAE
jgi:hypothetical protein